MTCGTKCRLLRLARAFTFAAGSFSVFYMGVNAYLLNGEKNNGKRILAEFKALEKNNEKRILEKFKALEKNIAKSSESE